MVSCPETLVGNWTLPKTEAHRRPARMASLGTSGSSDSCWASRRASSR